MLFLSSDHYGINLSIRVFVQKLSVEAGHGQVASRSFYPFILSALFSANADTQSLSEWLGRANEVAIIKIIDGRVASDQDGSPCQYTYGVVVEKSVRGWKRNTVVTDAALSLGQRYWLVVARDVPWENREFANDVPRVDWGDLSLICDGIDASDFVRSAEIRPIEQNYLARKDWVAFPQFAFQDSPGLVVVRDSERIEIVGGGIVAPGVQGFDYFLLTDLISLVR